MGLDIKCISKDYEDDDGQIAFDNNCHIGYFGFYDFRNDIVKLYLDLPKIDCLDLLFDNVLGEEDGSVCTLQTYDDGIETKIKKRDKIYYNELLALKKIYPKYYSLHALVAHCDCDGEIPTYQCKEMIKPLKQLKIDFAEEERKRWEEFIDKLVELMEKAVEINGRLLFV